MPLARTIWGSMNTRKVRVAFRAVNAVAACALVMVMTAPSVSAALGSMAVTATTTLTEDQQGPITIMADGVTLDCAGHQLTGPGFAGIDLTGRTGVTVKNCRVSGFQIGLYLNSSSGNTLANNVAQANAEGIRLQGSSRNHLSDNTVAGSAGHGLILDGASSGNSVSGNTAQGNVDIGFVAVNSDGNTFTGNVARANARGFAALDPLMPTLKTWRSTAVAMGSSFIRDRLATR